MQAKGEQSMAKKIESRMTADVESRNLVNRGGVWYLCAYVRGAVAVKFADW